MTAGNRRGDGGRFMVGSWAVSDGGASILRRRGRVGRAAGNRRHPDRMLSFLDQSVDALLLLKALILGIVEGLTEFLPVSSTGHLILAGDLLDFNDDRGKLFEIVIQSGAILAVVWEYRARIAGVVRGLGRERLANRFVLNLFIAFLPLAILGLAVQARRSKPHLFSPLPVATGLHRRRAS